MNEIIETKEVYKKYSSAFGRKKVEALRGVSLTVARGEIVALLGLNGAGKSTMVKLLLDLVRPSSGKILLFGESVSNQRWKGRVGYLPESFTAPQAMTPQRVLRYLGQLSGFKGKVLNDRIEQMLEMLGLREVARQKVQTFSKGMVLRLGIAQALMHNPELLILDEPTDGLDPAGRRLIRNMLVDLANKGVTILINSHLLSEVELIAHRVGILHKGRLIVLGGLPELLPQNQHFEVETAAQPAMNKQWSFRPTPTGWSCEVSSPETLQQLLFFLQSCSVQVLSVKPVQTTLEDVFFKHISKASDDQ
jgi:ABC-2 type transport system ATP-binding protein